MILPVVCVSLESLLPRVSRRTLCCSSVDTDLLRHGGAMEAMRHICEAGLAQVLDWANRPPAT